MKATDGMTYEFGNTGSIYRRDSDGGVVRVYKDPNGKIKGAFEQPRDNNKTYLVWATDTHLHEKELPGRSDWNDVDPEVGWPKNNLTSCDWHTMGLDGGALLIANKSWIALVGYDGSYTNEALNLIPGNEAKTIVERDGRVIIGTSRTSDPDRSINGAIDSEVPLSQVGEDGELYYANMSDSIPIKQFPGGGKVNPGGVCNEIDQVNFFEWEQTALSWIDKQSVGNMSLWGVYGASSGYNGIYSYGRMNKNKPFTLNLDYEMDVDEIGAICSVNGVILASYRDGTDFGVRATDPNNKAVGIYEGLELKARSLKKSLDITEWRTAEVYCEPLPDGTQIEFYYKIDKNGDFIRAEMENGLELFRAHGETKAIFFIGSPGDIFEPKIITYPYGNQTPEIHRIRMYFE